MPPRRQQITVNGRHEAAMKRRPDPVGGTIAAIGHSLDVYYRDEERTRRMDRLNAEFVSPGCRVFDIGAHVGDRTGSFLRLGASSVVTVEPQPPLFRALRLIYGRESRVILRQCAVGARGGVTDMYVNSANPTVSTLARSLVETAPSDMAWRGQEWDQKIRVPVITLDQLIAEHGMPGFIKIDVEGHECAVLEGLSARLPALSLEVTTLQRHVAQDAIARLAKLGSYTFNISLGEEHRLHLASWIGVSDMCELIDRLPPEANSGDVYARLDHET
jgi:FkbM family methyltransferase